MTKFEIMMFAGDAVVDGSRMITSDENLVREAEQFAKEKGFTFSCTKLKEE